MISLSYGTVYWLVVLTPLKNISQLGVYIIPNIWKNRLWSCDPRRTRRAWWCLGGPSSSWWPQRGQLQRNYHHGFHGVHCHHGHHGHHGSWLILGQLCGQAESCRSNLHGFKKSGSQSERTFQRIEKRRKERRKEKSLVKPSNPGNTPLKCWCLAATEFTHWKASTQPSRRKRKKAKKAKAVTSGVASVARSKPNPQHHTISCLKRSKFFIWDLEMVFTARMACATLPPPSPSSWGPLGTPLGNDCLRHCYALPWSRCCSPCRRIRRILRPTSSCPTGSSPKLAAPYGRFEVVLSVLAT